MCRKLLLCDVPFTVRFTDDLRPLVAEAATHATTGVCDVYANPSDVKRCIWRKWREWYAEIPHVTEFGVCSHSPHFFSISGIVSDNAAKIFGVLHITHADNYIYMTRETYARVVEVFDMNEYGELVMPCFFELNKGGVWYA